MEAENATKRKIAIRPWLQCVILLMVILWLSIRCFSLPVTVTTVYIVRHAEKEGNISAPPLSTAGQARAENLRHVLSDVKLDVVYTTNFIRTQMTAAPVAAAAGVSVLEYQAADTQGLVEMILAENIGQTVLVVGYSNTVDDIASGLGTVGLSDLQENQFDRLFVVHCFDKVPHLDQLRYGVETP